MKLYDMNTETEYSIPALFTEWETFRKEDPQNHAESFKRELFTVLMDTVNGRNDYTITGITSEELERYIKKMRRLLQ